MVRCRIQKKTPQHPFCTGGCGLQSIRSHIQMYYHFAQELEQQKTPGDLLKLLRDTQMGPFYRSFLRSFFPLTCLTVCRTPCTGATTLPWMDDPSHAVKQAGTESHRSDSESLETVSSEDETSTTRIAFRTKCDCVRRHLSPTSKLFFCLFDSGVQEVPDGCRSVSD